MLSFHCSLPLAGRWATRVARVAGEQAAPDAPPIGGSSLRAESYPAAHSAPRAQVACVQCACLFLCDAFAPKAVCPRCGYVVVRRVEVGH